MSHAARRTVLIVIVAATLLTATIVAVSAWTRRLDSAIPQADLLGSASPSAPASPSSAPSPSRSPRPLPGSDIGGPLDILLVGIDTRENKNADSWPHHNDVVMILHIAEDLQHAYLTSLPRDLVVDIPEFAPSGYRGGHSKLTHALTFGSKVRGSSRLDYVQGFPLVDAAVREYTGIDRFDAAALITFNGYRELVDALGGIDIVVDQEVSSIHRRPDGRHRTPCSSCSHGYSGPRAVYEPGPAHLVGWQALDYARQRYTSGGEYTRQRHHRQLIKAMVARIAELDLVGDPLAISRIVVALGKTMVFDGRGQSPIDFAYALRGLRADRITLVGLPGGAVYSRGGQYLGEQLYDVQESYFAALRADALDRWVATHPKLVNGGSPAA